MWLSNSFLSIIVAFNEGGDDGYSVVGTVVGIIVAIVVIVIITGIVYGGVSYQCKHKQKQTQLLSEQGSTVSVSLSKDPELVLSELRALMAFQWLNVIVIHFSFFMPFFMQYQ